MKFEDLFDIEKRPGAGAALWTKAVELQLERVREVNYRHRLNSTPNAEEKREDPHAEYQLHAEVYFLTLAIRRVLLFHDALAKQVNDRRLSAARQAFVAAAPHAKDLRDFYEHLSEYLLDDPSKHQKFPGRAAPVLRSRWDCDNVEVQFGPLRLDVTRAAVAAIELGRATELVWDECLERSKHESSRFDPPPEDEDSRHTLEVTLGVSTIIGSDDNPPEVATGTLLDVTVRPRAETAEDTSPGTNPGTNLSESAPNSTPLEPL